MFFAHRYAIFALARRNCKVPINRKYIAIDLKSFYASVECVERGLDPLDALLVVADKSRTDKTICLAVSPALKAYGTGGRPRLFEVVQRVREVNSHRGRVGTSTSGAQLAAHPELAVDYLVAPPRMALYIDYSTRVFNVYLRYVAPEDIHVYSIDEAFIDVTNYLASYRMTAHELAMTMIREVLRETGVTATAGIGTNLYLAKIAMDIVAKKMPPDSDGVRIAELDEMSYRHTLWEHEPLTDFWRVGRGTAHRLAQHGIYTMGDIALTSHRCEGLLYKLLGINAELLIDHAWGWEPVTIDLIKSYRPETHSISSGQVLTEPYTAAKARNVVLEMVDVAALDLVDKLVCTSQVTLTVGYDVESITRSDINYNGRIHIDHYGRKVPQHAHGTVNFNEPTSSRAILSGRVAELFDRIVNQQLLIRRLTLSFNNLVVESEDVKFDAPIQFNLFDDIDEQRQRLVEKRRALDKERRIMKAEIMIKRKFGKNAILSGKNFADGATQRARNGQIGGHHE